MSIVSCRVCGNGCDALAPVDFDRCCAKSCDGLPKSDVKVEYVYCRHCGFCFAPMFLAWRQQDFADRIYNDDYAIVDPDSHFARPAANAVLLIEQFGAFRGMIRHLDYGGGNGKLADALRDAGWNSTSFDPYRSCGAQPEIGGKYNLITAFEVFEHVTEVKALASRLAGHLDEPGLILFSTLASDGHVAPDLPLNWWYAAPRNGHVSLFSANSLELLGLSAGLNFCSFSANLHAYWKSIPVWAAHLFRWESGAAAREFSDQVFLDETSRLI